MHGTTATDERAFDVRGLSRVEGEGSLRLRIRDGVVEQAHLEIWEAPRYFERLVVGRSPDEVLDIVARICGICPVAYQMSAVHAFEDLFGVAIDPEVRALRRLFYCGEWIESHALHVYLLHAPDFLGYPSAIELAADHRDLVEQGLALKRSGNRIVGLLGGRPIHPVSPRVGGFSRVPTRAEIAALVPDLEAAVEHARATVDVVAGLSTPGFERDPRLVALRTSDASPEYPMNHGRIVSTDGLDIDARAWETAFEEDQVGWSNALHARTRAGEVYLLGPAARVTLDADRLLPTARAALDRLGPQRIRRDPFWSIAARAVELVQATEEALAIATAYAPPARPRVPWAPRAGIAAWATEAPRGMLFHRYDVGPDGLIAGARIVAPTSQNQAAIEADLATYAPSVLELDHATATRRLEQLVRSYDPCISCATHFLDLRIERT